MATKEKITVIKVEQYYDYTTPMAEAETKAKEDMEIIKKYIELYSPNPTGKPINTITASTTASIATIATIAASTAPTAAASAGGKTKKKQNKKTKKSGRRPNKKSKNRKKKSRKNKNKQILKLLKKIKQKAGSNIAPLDEFGLGFELIRSKFISVLNYILQKKSNPAAAPQSDAEQSASELNIENFGIDNRRCLFKITLRGNNTYFLKAAPVFGTITNDKAIITKMEDHNNTEKFFDASVTGSYYYEAEIYEAVNDEATIDPEIENNVLKFHGKHFKSGETIPTNIEFNTMIINIEGSGINDQLLKLKGNITPQGYIFLLTEYDDNFKTTVKNYMRTHSGEETHLKNKIVTILKNLYDKIGFVHYDLHGGNCLINLSTKELKLFDFDLSQITIKKNAANNIPSKPNEAESNSKSLLYKKSDQYYNIIGSLYSGNNIEKDKAIRLAGVLWDVYRIFNHWGFTRDKSQQKLEECLIKVIYNPSSSSEVGDINIEIIESKKLVDFYRHIKTIVGEADYNFLVGLLLKIRNDKVASNIKTHMGNFGLLKYNILRTISIPLDSTAVMDLKIQTVMGTAQTGVATAQTGVATAQTGVAEASGDVITDLLAIISDIELDVNKVKNKVSKIVTSESQTSIGEIEALAALESALNAVF